MIFFLNNTKNQAMRSQSDIYMEFNNQKFCIAIALFENGLAEIWRIFEAQIILPLTIHTTV